MTLVDSVSQIACYGWTAMCAARSVAVRHSATQQVFVAVGRFFLAAGLEQATVHGLTMAQVKLAESTAPRERYASIVKGGEAAASHRRLRKFQSDI